MLNAGPSILRGISTYRRQIKGIVAGLWLLLIGAYFFYLYTYQLSATEALEQIILLLKSPWGPLLYIVVYTLSPLIFFSAAVLAITAGCVFGAGSFTNLALAMVYTIIGSLGAAQTAYWMGAYFGTELLPAQENTMMRYATRMRKHSFMTVLIMHLLFLPYELVNYLAGILRINRFSFLAATFLGSLPGLFTFVPFGASLDVQQMLAGNGPVFSWQMLLTSVSVFLFSLIAARYLRKYEPKVQDG